MQHDYAGMLTMTTAQAVTELTGHITGRVLDIGCGSKPYKRMFPDLEWVGADIRHVGDVVADAENLPFGEEFDTVLCTNLLQYLDIPTLAMSEFARVLKPGGKLILITSAVHSTDPEVRCCFHARGLQALANAVGMKVIHTSMGGRLFSAEWDGLVNVSKWNLPVPQNIGSILETMDGRYPLVTSMVAQK